MSRFMQYTSPDDVRPSDSYLSMHPITDVDVYDPDVWFDDNYDLDDDIEILTMPRVCSKCGCTFTIEDAEDEYYQILSMHHSDFRLYRDDYEGEYCGACAAEDFEEHCIYEDDLDD